MIEYARERFDDVSDDIPPLLDKHWREIAVNQDKIKLKPIWHKYKQMDADGTIAIFTARDDGKLVGYFVLFVMQHLHYSDHIFAVNDIVYIDPDYRRGMTAARFFKFCEKELTESGVSVMIVNSKEHAPFGKLLERLGFSFTERVYTKALI